MLPLEFCTLSNASSIFVWNERNLSCLLASRTSLISWATRLFKESRLVISMPIVRSGALVADKVVPSAVGTACLRIALNFEDCSLTSFNNGASFAQGSLWNKFSAVRNKSWVSCAGNNAPCLDAWPNTDSYSGLSAALAAFSLATTRFCIAVPISTGFVPPAMSSWPVSLFNWLSIKVIRWL